jgi:hypothetical protein
VRGIVPVICRATSCQPSVVFSGDRQGSGQGSEVSLSVPLRRQVLAPFG